MPILETPGGGNENDPFVIDSTFCDDIIMTSSSACEPEPEVSTTENDDFEENDVESEPPKRRGPKKQPMTKARLAKVKVRFANIQMY